MDTGVDHGGQQSQHSGMYLQAKDLKTAFVKQWTSQVDSQHIQQQQHIAQGSGSTLLGERREQILNTVLVKSVDRDYFQSLKNSLQPPELELINGYIPIKAIDVGDYTSDCFASSTSSILLGTRRPQTVTLTAECARGSSAPRGKMSSICRTF